MTNKTKATCNGAMLTVGFHTANPPLVWRFDLERNHSFTLALQGEDGDWELGITSPKGDFYSIVHFLTREDAQEAFAAVEKVLSRRSLTIFGTIKKVLLYVVLIAAITAFGIFLFTEYTEHGENATPIGSVSATTPRVQEGVPLSADDVLKPPAP